MVAKSSKTTTNGAVKPSPSTSRAWEALTPALSAWILEAVQSMGFERMTPVQASTIPLFSGYKDPVVEAVTGSGKTLAFLIPVVERLLKLEEPIPKHQVGAIVISPTRELATQIYNVLIQLLAFHDPSAASLPQSSAEAGDDEEQIETQTYSASTLRIVPQLLLGGGQTPQADLSHFLKQAPNLLIATPGRLLELLTSPYVHTPQSSFQVLVMDEADRLLDLGFADTLQKILQRLPKQRRTGLFSASVSDAVERLVKVGIQNPYRINVKVRGVKGEDDVRIPASLQVSYLTTPASHKIPTLLKLIASLDPPPLRTIAYFPTCAAVDYFQHLMPVLLPKSSHLQIIPLHGKHKQAIREKNLTRFATTPSPSLLLTTDLAARGLDIPAVDLTVQLDPPTDEKSFLHRAGRAGRAGRRGLALVFLLPGRESDDYPPFLAVRRTPVTPLADSHMHVDDATAAAATTAMRAAVRRDRALHDKAQAAFPGTVQAYRKHSATSIFRAQELPWADLAEAWALLRLPRMPEARAYPGPRDLGLAIDWAAYAYRDKAREAKRRAELAAPAAAAGTQAAAEKPRKRKGKPDAWSDNKAAAEEREARRAKRTRRRALEREAGMDDTERARAAEVAGLIAAVRRRNEAGDEEFEGFD